MAACRTKPERGAAMIVVLIVTLLIGAVGVGAWSAAQMRLVSGRRRARLARAERVAQAAVRVAAHWLESEDRQGLIDPPKIGSLDRDQRRPDRDGDGTGSLWSACDPPDDVRFKEGATDAREVFGGPDQDTSRDRFLGTAQGPDILLERGASRAEEYLDRLSALLDPEGLVGLRRIAFFAPPLHAAEESLATVEAVAEAKLPGGVPLTVRARGEVHRIRWGEQDRPFIVSSDAEFRDDAGWSWGEAVIGGNLAAAAPTWQLWSSGVPWADVEAPMRRDNDGDGTADDRDGDGEADWEEWQRIDEPVDDPWWRARVGGAWPDVEPSPAACEAAFPFGPWADPPKEPVKDGERSGVRLACPTDDPIPPVPEAWRAVAQAGPRGLARYLEEPSREGWFRLNGRGELRPIDELIPEEGGVVWLELAASRTAPLQQTFSGGQGGVVFVGGDVEVRGGARRDRPRVLPGDLRDPPSGPDGDHLHAEPEGPSASAWRVEDWVRPGEEPNWQPPRDGDTAPVHFRGVLAVDGKLTVRGDFRHAGALRAAAAVLDAQGHKIRVRADHGPSRCSRWGPPGAPRIWVRNQRILR